MPKRCERPVSQKGVFMYNKLRSIILFGALFLSAFVFSSLPAFAAASSSATASQTSTVSRSVAVHAVTVPQTRRDYVRGFHDGQRIAVRACRDSRHTPKHLHHKRRESDYLRGLVDGYNFALDHDRACRHR